MFWIAPVLMMMLSTGGSEFEDSANARLAVATSRVEILDKWSLDCTCIATDMGQCKGTTSDVQFCMVYFAKATAKGDTLVFAAVRTLDARMPYEFAFALNSQSSSPGISRGKLVLGREAIDLAECAFSTCAKTKGVTSRQFDEVAASPRLLARLSGTGTTVPAGEMTMDGRAGKALMAQLLALPRH